MQQEENKEIKHSELATKESQEKVPCIAKIAKPHLLRWKLEPNKTYLYCTCGYSNTQPFCDKTCDTSKDIKGWKPIEFKVTVEQTFWSLCGCKRSKSEPFCDGSHNTLDW